MLGASKRKTGRDWRILYVSWKPKDGAPTIISEGQVAPAAEKIMAVVLGN